MKPISVVIITLNEGKTVGRLLEDLAQQTYQNFEVILVDSNSDDNTCEVAESHREALPSLQIVQMDSRGVSLGRNRGAALAQHERLLFLDADVRLGANFLANAIERLESKQLDLSGAYMSIKQLPLAHKLGYGFMNLGLFATQYGFPTAIGACIFSTKTIHSRISGFDERITLCEDCDYVKRASRTWRFRLLPMSFGFDNRRLNQDGLLKTGFVYLRANIRRFFLGEIYNDDMGYKFAHYEQGGYKQEVNKQRQGD